MRQIALLLVLTVAACGIRPTGPAGQPSSTDVNPITGARGGSGAQGAR